ncbi:hypothetical protein [Actinophytocola sp.]
MTRTWSTTSLAFLSRSGPHEGGGALTPEGAAVPVAGERGV